METKQNIFKQFVLSIYSFKSYPAFLRAKWGRVILYSLLLAALSFAFTVILPLADLLPQIFGMDKTFVDEHVPYFELKDGAFFIEEPVIMDDAEGSSSLFYVTSDEEIPLDTAREILRGYAAGIMIDGGHMITKSAYAPDVQEFNFSQMDYANLELNREDLYGLIPYVKVFTVIMLIIFFMVYFAGFMFGTLVCALMGMAVNGAVRAHITFGGVFKLTVFARTLPVTVRILTACPPLYMRLHFIAFYAIFLVIIAFVLKAVSKSLLLVEES